MLCLAFTFGSMKYLLCSVYLLLVSSFVFCQTRFEGKLFVKGSLVLNYTLVLDIPLQGSIVKGFSITDAKGKEETKTRVEGVYNRTKKTIYIKEYEVIQTKVKAKDIVFCFVEGEFRVGFAKQDTTLIGEFIGKLPNKKEVCGTGAIFLKQAKHSTPKVVKEKKKQAQEEVVEQNSKRTLIDANTHCVWQSNEIQIELWDQGVPDNDTISVFLDGVLIESNISLTSVKQKLIIPISSGNHTLSILAENEGKFSPNTSIILSRDGQKELPFICHSLKGEMKHIRIEKK